MPPDPAAAGARPWALPSPAGWSRVLESGLPWEPWFDCLKAGGQRVECRVKEKKAVCEGMVMLEPNSTGKTWCPRQAEDSERLATRTTGHACSLLSDGLVELPGSGSVAFLGPLGCSGDR